MKRILTGTLSGVLFFLFTFPMAGSAAWKIHLKDGRSFITPEYREEGDQIKFERYGGTIGLPKDQVVSIGEIADFPEKAIPAPPGKTSVPKSIRETASFQETPSDTAVAMKEKNMPEKKNAQLAHMQEKRRILAEKEDVSKAFRAAKKAKDKIRKDALWQKLFQLREQLRTLQKKVMAENNGVLPPWWDQIK